MREELAHLCAEVADREGFEIKRDAGIAVIVVDGFDLDPDAGIFDQASDSGMAFPHYFEKISELQNQYSNYSNGLGFSYG